VIEIARQTMERATFPSLQLSIPLDVEARAAGNWAAAH